jgi:hypothetical protein
LFYLFPCFTSFLSVLLAYLTYYFIYSCHFTDLSSFPFADISHQAEEGQKHQLEVLFKAKGLLAPRLSYQEQMKHKMVVVVDGNSVADRFAEQLAMGSTV